MAITYYSEQYIRGVNTSDTIGRFHEVAARKINILSEKRKAIANDRTRSDEEKAVLYKRLQDEYGKTLEKSKNELARELLINIEAQSRAKESARGNMSLTESVQLIAALRQAGVDGDDLRAAAISDVRIAQAMVNSPEVVIRAAKWTPKAANEILERHFPDLVMQSTQLQADQAAYDRLSDSIDESLSVIKKRAPANVLETRVDESTLFSVDGED